MAHSVTFNLSELQPIARSFRSRGVYIMYIEDMLTFELVLTCGVPKLLRDIYVSGIAAAAPADVKVLLGGIVQ